MWVSYTQEIRTFFASNIKFGISLNKVFVSKTFFVNVVLLFFDSCQVASDFSVNLTNLHINFEIRCASVFAHVRKNSAIFIITLTFGPK